MHFEWDEKKNKKNKAKHGISFDEAKTVFSDSSAFLFADPDTTDEDRFLLLGFSINLRTLVVCHCLRENDEVIRLISARKATKKETKLYSKGKA